MPRSTCTNETSSNIHANAIFSPYATAQRWQTAKACSQDTLQSCIFHPDTSSFRRHFLEFHRTYGFARPAPHGCQVCRGFLVSGLQGLHTRQASCVNSNASHTCSSCEGWSFTSPRCATADCRTTMCLAYTKEQARPHVETQPVTFAVSANQPHV